MVTIEPTSGASTGNITVGATAPEANLSLEATQPQRKIRVLIVDDESSVRRVIVVSAKRLRPDKFEFVQANNSKEALDILKSDTNFDLIISDKDMPTIDDGITLVKERPQNIKFILMSSDIKSVTDSTLKIDRKVEKPITAPDLLFNTIDTVLAESIGENATSQAARATLALRPFTPKDYTILVVHESNDGRETFKELLQGLLSYKVITASHEEALEILRTNKEISLVYSNNGRGSNRDAGINLRREMLEDDSLANIPFVLNSGDMSIAERVNLSKLNLNYISGPISSDNLSPILEGLLNQSTPQ